MDKNLMKNILFMAIGAAAGSAVTWIVTKKYYERLSYREIAEIRELYRQKQAAKEAAERNEEAKRQLLENRKREELKEKAEKASKKYNGEAPKDYYRASEFHNIFSNPPDADELDLEEEIGEDIYELTTDSDYPSEGASEHPFLITEEEFASEKMVYDKVMLTLYRDGIARLEDTDELLSNVEELIGPDILKMDGLARAANSEDGMIYVRNDSRGSDYGILLKDEDFVPEEGVT